VHVGGLRSQPIGNGFLGNGLGYKGDGEIDELGVGEVLAALGEEVLQWTCRGSTILVIRIYGGKL